MDRHGLSAPMFMLIDIMIAVLEKVVTVLLTIREGARHRQANSNLEHDAHDTELGAPDGAADM